MNRKELVEKVNAMKIQMRSRAERRSQDCTVRIRGLDKRFMGAGNTGGCVRSV